MSPRRAQMGVMHGRGAGGDRGMMQWCQHPCSSLGLRRAAPGALLPAQEESVLGGPGPLRSVDPGEWRRVWCVARAPGTGKTRQGTRKTQRGGTQRLQGRGANDSGSGAGAQRRSLLLRQRGQQEQAGQRMSSVVPFPSWSRVYLNITGFPFPLGPFVQRDTIRTEVERGRIWTFEQQQALGFSSVTTNIRMTVIKLKSGGLWVHSPIAPTSECLALLAELGAPVEHIVLPTFAYEHKVFVGPFSRRFPRAAVWTAPMQWSWPLNLPPQLLGIFPTAQLGDPNQTPPDALPPWVNEIDYKVLSTPEVGIGPYVEVAFFHRSSRTLLVTDAVVLVPPFPPQVVPVSSLLAAAQNGLAVQVLSGGQSVPQVQVEDTPQFRSLGWQRMVLQILYFGPANLLDPSASFAQVAGRLTVSPVVKTLVFDKVPRQVLDWIDSICRDWSFTTIIPCHFSAPIRASPTQLRELFFNILADAMQGEEPPVTSTETRAQGLWGFLKASLTVAPQKIQFPEDDLRTLRSLDNALVSLGAVKKTGT